MTYKHGCPELHSPEPTTANMFAITGHLITLPCSQSIHCIKETKHEVMLSLVCASEATKPVVPVIAILVLTLLVSWFSYFYIALFTLFADHLT